MVGDPAEIDVDELEFADTAVQKLEAHKVSIEDVQATFSNAPEFFENLPGKNGTHVMLGPDIEGRFFYVVLIESSRPRIWRVDYRLSVQQQMGPALL